VSLASGSSGVKTTSASSMAESSCNCRLHISWVRRARSARVRPGADLWQRLLAAPVGLEVDHCDGGGSGSAGDSAGVMSTSMIGMAAKHGLALLRV